LHPTLAVIEDGQIIGRVYEVRYVPDDVRWFWPITFSTLILRSA